MLDTRINYYALQVALEKNCFPERSFAKLAGAKEKNKPPFLKAIDPAAINIFRTEDHFTWEQIGEMYGVSKHAAFNFFRRNTGKVLKPKGGNHGK